MNEDIKPPREDLDKIKIAVALRMARAAVGWSQEEVAQKLGMAKTSIARIETGEASMPAEKYFAFQRLYQSIGVDFNLIGLNHVTVSVSEAGLEAVHARMADSSLRRSDRVKPVPIAPPKEWQYFPDEEK